MSDLMVSDFMIVDYFFYGYERFYYKNGTAYVDSAPFIEGAFRMGSRYVVAAPDLWQDELCDYASLEKSQKKHWEKIRKLKGIERKNKIVALKKSLEHERKIKLQLPWASETTKAGFYSLTGMNGIYRKAKLGESRKLKALWIPNPVTERSAAVRYKNGAIRCFIEVKEQEIFGISD